MGHLRARCPNATTSGEDVTQVSQAVKVVPVKYQKGSVEHDDVITEGRQSSDRTAVGLHQFVGPSKLSKRGDEAENEGGDKQQ